MHVSEMMLSVAVLMANTSLLPSSCSLVVSLSPMCKRNRFRVLRLVGLLGAFAVAVCAPARPWFLDRFRAFYNPPAGSALQKANCRTCHDLEDGPPGRNLYGAQLEQWVKFPDDEPDKGVTNDVMTYVENVDTDQDGYTNLEEIVAGTLPGDPDSHPSSHPTNLPHHKMSRKINPLYVKGTGGLLLLAGLLGVGGKAAKKGYMTKLGIGGLSLGLIAAVACAIIYSLSNRHP